MLKMEDIAKLAGVSQATVSRVINQSPGVSAEKRERVMYWVRKKNFTPNISAKTLTSQKSFLLGIIVPDLVNPFFTEIVANIERVATSNGYNIIIANSDGNIQKENEIIRSFKARQIDGLLLVPASPDSPAIKNPFSLSMKSVIVTQDYDGFDCVSVSHYKGGALAAQHFLEQEVKEFIYFGPLDDDKYRGFANTLSEAKIDFASINTIGNETWWMSLLNKGTSIVKDYLLSHPINNKIGIFAVNDLYALGAVHAAKSLHLSIPDQISIIGFDDTFICQNVSPMLSSIFQPIAEIGRKAIDLVLVGIQEPSERIEQHIVLEPRLMRRETS